VAAILISIAISSSCSPRARFPSTSCRLPPRRANGGRQPPRSVAACRAGATPLLPIAVLQRWRSPLPACLPSRRPAPARQWFPDAKAWVAVQRNAEGAGDWDLVALIETYSGGDEGSIEAEYILQPQGRGEQQQEDDGNPPPAS